MNFQFRYAAVAPNGEIEPRRHALPQPIDVAIEAAHDLDLLAERPRARDDEHAPGASTADTRRLIGVGHVGRRSARRLSGLTRQGSVTGFGQRIFSSRIARPVGEARAERDARLPIPRAEQRFTEPLSLTLGDDERIRRPRAVGVEAANADAHRHQRTRGDHGRPFAHDRVERFAGLVRGIAPRPVPAQANRVGGLGAERASIQLLDAPPVVGAIRFDVRHARIGRQTASARSQHAEGGARAAKHALGRTLRRASLLLPGGRCPG